MTDIEYNNFFDKAYCYRLNTTITDKCFVEGQEKKLEAFRVLLLSLRFYW